VQAGPSGIKGIETIEDLAWVKSVVVEAVRPRGTSVLNADDANDPADAPPRRAGASRSSRSRRRRPESDRARPRRGRRPRRGARAGAGGGDIVIHDEGETVHLMRVAEIPATLDGLAEFNAANCAGGHRGLPSPWRAAPGDPHRALRPSRLLRAEPWRLNVFDGHGFR
jgi:cyanophycin synthetase